MAYHISVHYSYGHTSFTIATTDKGIMYDAVISITITIIFQVKTPQCVQLTLQLLLQKIIYKTVYHK